MIKKLLTRIDYLEHSSEACLSVMLDVISCIGKYREDFVLVGGLVPKVLLEQPEEHIGTFDVDFAINSHHISEKEYATIAELLFKRGYRYRKDRDGNNLKFSFEREIEWNGKLQKVEVDLLGPEYGTKGKGFRERVQPGVHVHKARGIDLVFDHFREVQVTARLPDGIEHTETINVVNGAAYLVLKAITFEARKSEKDAYDIYYCLKHYPGGVKIVHEELQEMREHGLVKEACNYLETLFMEPRKIGPQRFARFMSDDEGERQMYSSELVDLVKKLFS